MSAVVVGLVLSVCVLVATTPWAARRPIRPRRRADDGRPGSAVRVRPGVDGAHDAGRARATPWAGGGRGPGWGRELLPWRRRHGPPGSGSDLDPAFVLELCAAAVRGGAPVPTALAVTGRHLGGVDGDALARAGTALALGAPWDAAWAGAPPSVAALARALRGGWDAGASPGPALRAAAARLRRERRAHVRAAAGALGVRLTLPLGTCFLPAFVLLGLVPVVLGLAGDLRGVAP